MKPCYKEKIRLRSYNSSFEESFLEVKRKIGKVVVKIRIKLDKIQFEALLKKDEIPKDFTEK